MKNLFRNLEPGETIEPGDEVRGENTGWALADVSAGLKVVTGLYARRPVTFAGPICPHTDVTISEGQCRCNGCGRDLVFDDGTGRWGLEATLLPEVDAEGLSRLDRALRDRPNLRDRRPESIPEENCRYCGAALFGERHKMDCPRRTEAGPIGQVVALSCGCKPGDDPEYCAKHGPMPMKALPGVMTNSQGEPALFCFHPGVLKRPADFMETCAKCGARIYRSDDGSMLGVEEWKHVDNADHVPVLQLCPELEAMLAPPSRMEVQDAKRVDHADGTTTFELPEPAPAGLDAEQFRPPEVIGGTMLTFGGVISAIGGSQFISSGVTLETIHPDSGPGAEGAQRQAGDRDAGTPHISEASMIGNADARVWVKFFVRTIRDLADRGIQPAEGEPFFSSEIARIVLDEDYMLGWFANAMCAQHDAEEGTLARRLAVVKDMRETQGNTGNWDFDEYMRGLFNGLELAVSSMENREIQLRDGVKKHPQDKPAETGTSRNLGFWAGVNLVMCVCGWAAFLFAVVMIVISHL